MAQRMNPHAEQSRHGLAEDGNAEQEAFAMEQKTSSKHDGTSYEQEHRRRERQHRKEHYCLREGSCDDTEQDTTPKRDDRGFDGMDVAANTHDE